MKTQQPPTPSTPGRTALGLGLAFIVGSVAFFGAYLVAGYFRGDGNEPLISVEKRVAGNIAMPVLTAADVTPPATPADWKLSDHAGKVVVVNYFATWCNPCMAEIPAYKELEKEYVPRGVDFAAISLDQDGDHESVSREKTLRDFVKNEHFTIPILIPGPDAPIWRVSMSIPQTFVYDKHGRIARSLMGGIDGRGMKQTLEDLLKEQ